MLEKNQRFKSLLYVLADAALLFIGFLLANYIRFNYVRYFEPGGAGPALAVARDPRNIIAGLATSLVLVLIYWVAGIYSTTRLRGLAERCTKIAVINAAGLLIFIGALYLMHLDDYSRIVLALFYILGTAGVVIERMILRWVDRARRRKGLGLRHILLVGGGKSAALYLRALEHNPYYGFVVDGYLAGIEEPGLGVRYMGSYDALSARLDEVAVDEVVVALEADEIELLPHVFAACDKNGVRIAQLDELRYRQELWSHRPLTDFWRVGPGYAKKLEKVGLRTMGDVARCSVGKPTEFYNEDLLYKLFGVNAQLLIDHAWGWEPCTIADIKAYKPESSSISPGQVLQCPYTAEKARLVVREMADDLSLDLVDKGLVTDQIVLTVGYDIENLTDPERSRAYQGPVTVDRYGRRIPKHAHGTANLGGHTASSKAIVSAVAELYDRIVNSALLVRRLYLSANHIVPESSLPRHESTEQLDFFSDFASQEKRRAEEAAAREREKRRQQAVLAIKKKYGKNAILKGMDLEEGATARDRNGQIGGHKA